MITKEHFAGTAISNNYAGKTLNSYSNAQQSDSKYAGIVRAGEE